MATAKKKKSLNPFDDDDDDGEDLGKKQEEVVVQPAAAEKERVIERKGNKGQAVPPLKDREDNPAPPPLKLEPQHNIKAEKGSKKEPVPKYGHATATVNDKVYMWGGWRKGFPEVHSSQEKTSLLSIMEVFDLKKGEWSEVETYGSPPLGVRGYSCATIGTRIYYYGGYCGHDWCRHSSLHYFETTTHTWTNVPIANPYQSPMKKSSSGMVAFRDEAEDYLFVFGGVGMLCSANQSEAIYIPWKENPDNGWTNESHIFSLQSKEWITPEVKGERPPPCAGFTLTQITQNSALLYGGVDSTSGQCLNDTYIVELSKASIHWYKVEIMQDKPKPAKRHDHTAVCLSGPLFGQIKPMVLVAGGRDSRWKNLGDLWILDCSIGMWTKLEVSQPVAFRHMHSLSIFSIADYCVYAFMFGGIEEWIPNASASDQAILSDTTVLEICLNSDDQWEMSAVLASQILRETEEYKGRLIQRLFHVLKHGKKNQHTVISDGQEVMRLRGELEQAQLRVQEAERKAQSLQQEVHQLQSQSLPPSSQSPPLGRTGGGKTPPAKTTPPQTPKSGTPPLTRATPPTAKKSTSLFSRSPALTPKSKTTPVPAETGAPVDLTEPLPPLIDTGLDIRAQQIAIELTSDTLKLHLIPREDIASNGPSIDTGCYGHIAPGLYKGSLPVSVKTLKIKGGRNDAYSNVILNHKLVKSFQLRHPNIVQLLHVSMQHEGLGDKRDIVLVSEPLTITLQQQLTKKAIAKQDIINLSLDVAMALSYLHNHPHYPIVHGAVSTSGIILEPLALKWRAKLVDFFTANYFYYTSTETPFVIDPPYIPPSPSPLASSVPVLNTKFDIFCFGIVLLETVTRKQPPVEAAGRESLLGSVKWSSLAGVIRSCTSVLDADRPPATALLNDLHKL